MKTLEEYIKMYEKHTKEKFMFKQPFSFFYHPEHGFCEYHAEGDTLYIWQMCGDLDYWITIGLKTCHQFRLTHMASFVVRKPLPFIRALGFKVEQTENKGGEKRYTCWNSKKETLIVTQTADRHTFVWEVDLNV